MAKKIKVLWVSDDPIICRAFAQQSWLICSALEAMDYDVSLLGFGNRSEQSYKINNLNLYTLTNHKNWSDTGYIVKKINFYYNKLKPDIVIVYNVFHKYLIEEINKIFRKNIPWIYRFVQEWGSATEDVLSSLALIPYPMTESKFIQDLYIRRLPNLLFIPVAFNPRIFYPLAEKEKNKARKKMQINPTAFVIGSVFNANDFRKAPELMIRAFRKFAQDKDDVLFFIHTFIFGREKKKLCSLFDDLKRKINISHFSKPPIQQELNRLIYNVMDIFLLSTMGEGCGFPVIEAMFAKVPSIATNCTAMPELIGKDRGWLCRVDRRVAIESIPDLQWSVVNVNDMVAKLNDAYYHRDKLKRFGRNAYYFAKKRHSLANVMMSWDELLKEIAP